jgi:predicted dithiol-disulfide oxidoreductase (DUF899 family)
LLEKEKAHVRAGDRLAAERRGLPCLKLEKSYTFETEHGRKTLADLFNGGGQLVVHHLMYGPEWKAACPGCSFQAEHIAHENCDTARGAACCRSRPRGCRGLAASKQSVPRRPREVSDSP